MPYAFYTLSNGGGGGGIVYKLNYMINGIIHIHKMQTFCWRKNDRISIEADREICSDNSQTMIKTCQLVGSQYMAYCRDARRLDRWFTLV
jgi:hypothetical protein